MALILFHSITITFRVMHLEKQSQREKALNYDKLIFPRLTI